MPITNGTISLLRRVRTGDFEHIEPHVTLSFSVEPNEDAGFIANAVRVIVDEQYKHLLGIKVEEEKKTRKEKPAPLPEAAPSPAGPVAPTAAATIPATVAPPSPTVPPAIGAAFNAAGQPASPTVALAGAVSPPAVIGPPVVAPPSTPEPPAAVAPTVAPVAPAAGPSVDAIGLVSDETMAKKCQDKTDELNALYEPGIGLQKVVALIRQYIDPPGRATQIPPARRGEFLTNLSALA